MPGSEASVHDRTDHVLRASAFWSRACSGSSSMPLVHNRAVRLTMRRLEAATPLSMAEIQADKDQLRAEFAMSTRRLEMSVEQMKTKTTEPARRARQEDRRHQPPQDRARRKDRRDLRAGSARQGAQGSVARDRGRALRSRSARCAKPSACSPTSRPSSPRSRAELGERSATADSQRVEIVALESRSTALKEQVTAPRTRGARNRGTPTRASAGRRRRDRQELTEERGKVREAGRPRRRSSNAQLVAQTTEAEISAGASPELEDPADRAGQDAARRPRARDRDQLNADARRPRTDRDRSARRARQRSSRAPLRDRGAAQAKRR